MKIAKFVMSALSFATLVLLSAPAFAQQGECNSGFCGTPDQSGGGGCGCGCGCSILIANTDMGETYSTSDDFDNDGFEDDFDNCPFLGNTAQIDADGDLLGDACDNAPNVTNPLQEDIDGDLQGDVIDDDMDGDTLINLNDNCQRAPNRTQKDTNQDGEGDACDVDDDGDGYLDTEDGCPKLPGNTDQGSACDGDEDGDNLPDTLDNCPGLSNPDQRNVDRDLFGDACDTDVDGDEILNNLDNAPLVSNPDQLDLDRDGLGDADDPEFCYVVTRDSPCLNPNEPFEVSAVGAVEGIGQAEAGDEVRFILFANRKDVPIEYSWVVSGRPSGSEAVVEHATGKVVTSLGGYEYRYQTSGFVAPRFVPDEPGTYTVNLEAKLVFDDASFPGLTLATTSFPLEVKGESTGGCAATGGKGSLGASLGVMLLGMLLIRRRRA